MVERAFKTERYGNKQDRRKGDVVEIEEMDERK